LFDKDSSDISTGEGLVLFTVMDKVTGVDSFSIIDKMKTTLGLDTITIKKADSNKGEYDAVSIGKKIGKIQVSVEQGAAAGTTGVTVETKVAKNAKMIVDMSGKNSIGAGISWSRRY
jgi:autotransporter translocation and assembly factor TamB